MDESKEIPEKVSVRGKDWPTDEFKRNVLREQAEIRAQEARLKSLPPPELPSITVSFANIEDGSFAKAAGFEVKKEDLPNTESSSLTYLEKTTEVVERTVSYLAWE